MIKLRLKEAMEAYSKATGEKLTYEALALKAGISRSAVESLVSRAAYNPTLDVVDRLCTALGCPPADILTWTKDESLGD